MASKSVHISVGDIRSSGVSLSISCMAGESGTGNVFISCQDSHDRRKAIHRLLLDSNGYRELKRLISDTDAAIDQLKKDGNLNADQFAFVPERVFSGKKVRIDLTSYSRGRNIPIILIVRTISGLGLAEAKKLVESAPCTLFAGVPIEDVEQISSDLREAGAQFTAVPIEESV